MLFRLLLVMSVVMLAVIPIVRAGDDPKTNGEGPAAADSEAPLPEGWPAATKPGVIEIKVYPAYRSAVARDDNSGMRSQSRLFWPLFMHIQREGIAMTAPVVMTYDSNVVEKPGEKGKVSMEFLYRQPDQGHAGDARGGVKVEDRPAETFVCVGIQGRVDETTMAESTAKLRSWLGEHKSQWVAAGDPRRLGYHGPGTPIRRQLGEVQIPVKPVGGDSGKVSSVPAAK